MLFVEDPGALNYFVPLIKELKIRELPFKLYSAGHATGFLKKKKIDSLDFSPEVLTSIQKNVQLVIVGTSENLDSFAFDLIQTAKKHAVPCVAIVDSGVNAAYRFRGHTNSELAYAPDYIFVPDDWSVKEYIKLGYDPFSIFNIGQPTHTIETITETSSSVRECILPVEAAQRNVIVFVSEISTGLNESQYKKNDTYTLNGRGLSLNRTEIVVEELLDSLSFLQLPIYAKPYLILRLHPKETKMDLGSLVSEFDYVSIDENPIELVSAADLVVGMTSMLLSEAHWLGKTCLSIVPKKEERDWLPTTRSGAIPCISDRNNLRKFMSFALAESGVNNASNKKRAQSGEKVFCVDKTLNILMAISASALTLNEFACDKMSYSEEKCYLRSDND